MKKKKGRREEGILSGQIGIVNDKSSPNDKIKIITLLRYKTAFNRLENDDHNDLSGGGGDDGHDDDSGNTPRVFHL